MLPDWSRREVLAGLGSTVAVGLAGCTGRGPFSRPTASGSLGGMAYVPVVGGQPLIDEGVPAAWGVIFSHPDAARKLVDWGALTPREGDAGPGVEFRTFDPDAQFVTVIVGVLPTGYGLTGYGDETDTILEDIVADFEDRSAFDDGRLRYEVTPYRAFTPDPGTPDAHYDYTFELWDLNGHDRPTEIRVEFHP